LVCLVCVCLVLDEADEMLRMGFAESVEWCCAQAPEGRQTALFTSHSAVSDSPQIAQRRQRDPAEVTIVQRAAAADSDSAALCRCLESSPSKRHLLDSGGGAD
jgi:superfamily II DNA/RNA helicase